VVTPGVPGAACWGAPAGFGGTRPWLGKSYSAHQIPEGESGPQQHIRGASHRNLLLTEGGCHAARGSALGAAVMGVTVVNSQPSSVIGVVRADDPGRQSPLRAPSGSALKTRLAPPIVRQPHASAGRGVSWQARSPSRPWLTICTTLSNESPCWLVIRLRKKSGLSDRLGWRAYRSRGSPGLRLAYGFCCKNCWLSDTKSLRRCRPETTGDRP
jgi:hypothetical protein